MKRFSKELELSGWEGFRLSEAFNDEIKIDFGPTVIFVPTNFPSQSVTQIS